MATSLRILGEQKSKKGSDWFFDRFDSPQKGLGLATRFFLSSKKRKRLVSGKKISEKSRFQVDYIKFGNWGQEEFPLCQS